MRLPGRSRGKTSKLGDRLVRVAGFVFADCESNSVQSESSPDDNRGRTARSKVPGSFLRCFLTPSATFKNRGAIPIITVAIKTASDFARCKTCKASLRSSYRASAFRCAVITDLFSTHTLRLCRSGRPFGAAAPTRRSIFLPRAPGVFALSQLAIPLSAKSLRSGSHFSKRSAKIPRQTRFEWSCRR